ncbi:MAG: cupin [Gammaproteobacteria bacterium]|nr:cupin [Gammaproteobacteria bacterium]
MSELRIYDQNDADAPLAVHTDFEATARELAAIGVQFERWQASRALDAQATQDEIIEAYREPINRLMNQRGFKSVDVISVHPDYPQAAALRAKFLAEHTHDDHEVRFFVEGQGLFYIHSHGRVYGMLCTRGDLIDLPAGATHWFDMGPQPRLKAIRLFTTPEGWVAEFTGTPIAERFPRLEAPHYPLQQAAQAFAP